MRPLHVGVLGCAAGRAYYGAALSACPSVRVTAIVDRDTRMARAWAREIGGEVALFADLAALLAAPSPCDAVLITAPLQERAATIATLARAGKPMLCPV